MTRHSNEETDKGPARGRIRVPTGADLPNQQRSADGVRFPISWKIFGIALGLLILMTAVTGLSSWKLTRVQQEVEALADYYIPLTELVNKMELHLRQELIHLERIVLVQQFQHVPLATLKPEQESFEAKGRDVQADVASALQLLTKALTASTVVPDKAMFVRLDPEIRDINRAHQHLEESVLKYLAEVKYGDQHSISVLHDVIVEERKNFDAEVRDVRRELARFTERSAIRASELQEQARRMNWAITLTAGVLGLAFASMFTRSLVKPVRRLLQGTKSVEQGNLAIELAVSTADEIAALTKSFNHMVAELRQKELIKDTFGKYVDPRIVKGLIEDQRLAQAGERRTMTVFFSDLEGFTSLSERLTPEHVVRVLNRYFALMSQPINQHQGILDKYLGDGIMAFWGPPFTSETEHPDLACRAALEQIAKLEEFRQMLPELLGLRKGLPTINLRIGIATGDVTVGSIGSEFSKGYTVIGDTVNLAARLETANKQYGTHILISEDTWKLAQASIEVRELDYVRVVGKSDPVRVFEVLAEKNGLTPAQRALRDHFEEGLHAYRLREWERAETAFRECVTIDPDDFPSTLLLSRTLQFKATPPGEEWDGAWSLSQK